MTMFHYEFCQGADMNRLVIKSRYIGKTLASRFPNDRREEHRANGPVHQLHDTRARQHRQRESLQAQ